MAAMWAVLTRLEPPNNASLTLIQKLKLYNGKTLPGFTEENIKEMRAEATTEGMHGISPRYVQDKISNALVAHLDAQSINPFHGDERVGGRPQASLADHQRRAARQVPRAAWRGERGV
jgi:predicted Ser/Thr protein kinase